MSGFKRRGVIVYSCYISPNIPLDDFETFVSNLAEDIRAKGKSKIIITGDFNAKAPVWGGPGIGDERGNILQLMFASADLTAMNETGAWTFERRGTGSVIDLTAVTSEVLRRAITWEVLEEEALSPHKYILFAIEERKGIRTEWVRGPIDRVRLGEELRLINARESTAEGLVESIKAAYDRTTARVRTENGKIPYWWTAHIADLRLAALQRKRRATRSRARGGGEEEALEYKSARKELRCAIKKSKKACWERLLEDLDNDVFGDGYRIVTKSMNVSHPPLTLTRDEKEVHIRRLFPDAHATEWVKEPTQTVPLFTHGELTEAARKLKNGKAPGKDGVPSEAIKEAVEHLTQEFLEVLNGLLREGTFPKKWKEARVVLCEKPKKDPLQNKAYRPICLINSAAKLLEHMILCRLEKEVDELGGLSPHQHGFRKGHSTIHAVEEVLEIANRANRSFPRERCAMALVDIRNAFNTASWRGIIDSLERKGVSAYIINIIKDYLSEREIQVGNGQIRKVNIGVPQGSVLGPFLWNMMYDGIFGMDLPEKVTLIGYADDVAIIGTHRDSLKLTENLNTALERVESWLAANGLQMAPEKTEALQLRFGRRRTIDQLEVGGSHIVLSPTAKYLGVVLDSTMTLGPHIREAAFKAEAAVRALIRLMPNIGGPGEKKRRVLGEVAESIMLYGAPVWAKAMAVASYRGALQRVQRRIALRICRAYRTVSYEAVMVVAAIIPIQFLARERLEVWSGEHQDPEVRRQARETTMVEWQQEWSGGSKGAWTRRLIPEVAPWIARKHGQTNYQLTGHGSFRTFTHAIGKSADPNCVYCHEIDTPEHTLFQCNRWAEIRGEMAVQLGEELHAGNIVEIMLRDEICWRVVERGIVKIMTYKERDERAGGTVRLAEEE